MKNGCCQILIISCIIINMDNIWIAVIINAVCNKDCKMDANEEYEEWVLPNTGC